MFDMLNFSFNLLSEVIRAEAETCLKLKMKIDILVLHLHLMIFALVHTKVQAIQNTRSWEGWQFKKKGMCGKIEVKMSLQVTNLDCQLGRLFSICVIFIWNIRNSVFSFKLRLFELVSVYIECFWLKWHFYCGG